MCNIEFEIVRAYTVVVYSPGDAERRTVVASPGSREATGRKVHSRKVCQTQGDKKETKKRQKRDPWTALQSSFQNFTTSIRNQIDVSHYYQVKKAYTHIHIYIYTYHLCITVIVISYIYIYIYIYMYIYIYYDTILHHAVFSV